MNAIIWAVLGAGLLMVIKALVKRHVEHSPEMSFRQELQETLRQYAEENRKLREELTRGREDYRALVTQIDSLRRELNGLSEGARSGE